MFFMHCLLKNYCFSTILKYVRLRNLIEIYFSSLQYSRTVVIINPMLDKGRVYPICGRGHGQTQKRFTALELKTRKELNMQWFECTCTHSLN